MNYGDPTAREVKVCTLEIHSGILGSFRTPSVSCHTKTERPGCDLDLDPGGWVGCIFSSSLTIMRPESSLYFKWFFIVPGFFPFLYFLLSIN